MSIPSVNNIPTMPQAVSHLLESIALEERALANLIATEADKVLAFVGSKRDFPANPSPSEIIEFNQSFVQILDSLLMAEWLLFKKLNTIIHIPEQMTGPLQGSSRLSGSYSEEVERFYKDEQNFDY